MIIRSSLLLVFALAACSAPTRNTDPAALHAEAGFEVILLEFAVAEDVAAAVGKLLIEHDTDDFPIARVAADPRTNAVMIYGTYDEISEIKDLIVQLDVKVGG